MSAQQPDEKYIAKGSTGLRAGIVAGPSLLLEKAPDSLQSEFRDYLNNLRSGWHYGLQAEYYFIPYLGAGFKYARFTTSQEVDSIITEIFSTKYYISISNNMHIHTLMPMVYGKIAWPGKKVVITGGLGPAWLLYRNIYESIDDSASFKGSSPGLSTSIRVTYQVIPSLHIGFESNYLRAFLKGYTKDNGTTQEEENFESEEYQNLSRFDFSFGIYYSLERSRKRN